MNLIGFGQTALEDEAFLGTCSAPRPQGPDRQIPAASFKVVALHGEAPSQLPFNAMENQALAPRCS